ncbi:hypothetical protein [Trinickia dinghuensis]|uniref:ATP-binding protein n=1 Tax=Trinickia dinghuensis TaxID=2291023 RepID=A0A3D8K1V2_9BURK|nr:hypothetical protein [Trinickia dinghuensis]RDU99229.1 hypothetical protein DWV00_08895 [Trinickia dinghuensis]
MTTTSVIRAAAVSALTGSTSAGNNVFFARTWPTQGPYPALLVQPLDETGESWGNAGAPAFNVTVTLKVLARTAQPAAAPGSAFDAGSMAVAEALETLRDEVKAAIINNPTLMGAGAPVQEFSSFRCALTQAIDSEEPMAEMSIEIDMVTVQGPRDFYQPTLTPLQGVDVTVQEPDGTTVPGLTINFTQ